MSSTATLRGEKSGLGRFGTFAGAVAGLVVGLGIALLHSALSDSAPRPTPSPVATATELPLPGPVPAIDRVNMADDQAAQVKAHHESIARHEREPRDEAWATQTERMLTDLLAKLAEQRPFKLTPIDCRTTTCVAYFSTANYLDARKAWPGIVNADTECGTEVTLDQPPPGDSAFDFSAVFDCSKGRRPKAPQQ